MAVQKILVNLGMSFKMKFTFIIAVYGLKWSVCMPVRSCSNATVWVCRSEGGVVESVFSFHLYVGSRDETWVASLA